MLTRTHDLDLVSWIMAQCFDDISDETTHPDAQADPDQIHLLVRDAGTLGVISIFQAWSGAWSMHLCFVPGKRKHVKEALREVPAWVKANTPATCLMGITRDTPELAAAIRVMGGNRVGTLERALLRNGGENAVVWQRAL